MPVSEEQASTSRRPARADDTYIPKPKTTMNTGASTFSLPPYLDFKVYWSQKREDPSAPAVKYLRLSSFGLALLGRLHLLLIVFNKLRCEHVQLLHPQGVTLPLGFIFCNLQTQLRFQHKPQHSFSCQGWIPRLSGSFTNTFQMIIPVPHRQAHINLMIPVCLWEVQVIRFTVVFQKRLIS